MLFAATLTGTLQYVLGGILIFVSLVLMVLILFQSAKDKSLSGTITGAADTFFGKSKTGDRDKLLSKLTIVFAVLAFLVTVALVIIINTLKI
ncbi:MAG: preprotein translocase subunit SecG [Clostridia bacterium]|nr:preprotein translocase subunit SecG [Clostridia bacterium]